MRARTKPSFYFTLERICWLVVSICIMMFLMSITATFAPEGHWLMYTLLIGSLVGGSISLLLGLWSRRRRAKTELPPSLPRRTSW